MEIKRASKLLTNQGHRAGCDITAKEYEYYTGVMARRMYLIRDNGGLMCDNVSDAISSDEYDEMIKEDIRQKRNGEQ